MLDKLKELEKRWRYESTLFRKVKTKEAYSTADTLDMCIFELKEIINSSKVEEEKECCY
jgi:hypothetical protein